MTALSTSLAYAREKGTAFALIGDRPHNSDYIRTALNRDIVKGLGVSVDMTDDYTSLTAETLEGYKMLIVHRDGNIYPEGSGTVGGGGGRPGRGGRSRSPEIEIISEPPLQPTSGKSEFWMKPEQGKAVRQFVENGGSALFLHNVTHVALSDPDFRHVLGAAYQGHPPIRPFKVKVKNSNHPITKGVNDFVVTDEQHYMQYDKDPKHILLESVNENDLTFRDLGGTAPAGWAYEYGKGRVSYFSPGHLLTAHWNPEYVKLKHNAVRWLLKQSS
jgi:hypothetical protein